MSYKVNSSVLITFCVTTYNRWDFCANALRSVLEQGVDSAELILVDDFSMGVMPEEIRRLIDQNKVRYIRHQENRGLASSRNTAIENARGQYFAFCDDDDCMGDGYAKKVLEMLSMVDDSYAMALAFDRRVERSWNKLFGGASRLQQLFAAGVTPPVGSQVYSTEMLRRVGGYNCSVKSGVDHDLWVRLLSLDPVVKVVFGCSAYVGSDPSRNRMTTAEERRREGLSFSLALWKDSIERVYGADFYKRFCQAYDCYQNFRFFSNSLLRGQWLDLVGRYQQSGIFYYLLRWLYYQMLGYRPINTFPDNRKYVCVSEFKGSGL